MWLVDSLLNLMSGLGTAKDKTVGNQHVFVPRTLVECRSAYRGNWIARKVVDIVPFDMLREWRAWQASPKEVELLEAAEKALGVQGKLLDGLKRARLEGGSAILIGDGGNATTELMPTRLAQGGIKWLHVFGREEIVPEEPILDPDSPWFGEPKAWTLNSQREGAVRIHPSRVIRLVGAPILDTVSSQAEQGWGDSVLQALFEALDQATSSPAYLAAMLPEAKQDIISVPGLSGHLKTAASTAELTKRFQYAAQMKSMFGMLLLEGDGKSPAGELFQQKQLSFDGLPDVVKLFLMIAAAAADIPATRFLSQSPQGMNATGDSDTRNYYDRCASGQKVELTPAIARLDELLIWNALGKRPPSVWYQWGPLYQPTQKEKGDAFKVLADGLKVLSDAGLAPAEILAQGAKGMVIDTGLFPGIDKAYADHGDAALTEADPSADQYDSYGYPDEGYTGTGDPGNVIPFPGRAALGDASPRTLYVSRKLKNGDDVLAWARSQGFVDLMPAGELHVTIAYSRTAVDWMKVGQTWNGEELKVTAGGPRLVERFGEAIVLLFASDELRWRHQEIREAGASWDHPEYQPHVTFTWAAGDVDLSEVEPYNGPLLFGPELFEPIDEDWRAGLTADADMIDARRSKPHHEAAGTGRFEEQEHPRGSSGRWSSKGTGEKATGYRSRAGRNTGEIDRRVARDWTIHPRDGAREGYRPGMTVEEYVSAVGDRRRAYQHLVADAREGRISLQAPAGQQFEAGRGKWGWSETEGYRGTYAEDSGLTVRGDEAGRELGLWRDTDGAWTFADRINSGVPDGVSPTTILDGRRFGRGDAEVTLSSQAEGDVTLNRTFYSHDEHGLTVSHDYFALNARHRGGYAKRMMRNSLHAYDEVGVRRIEVHADIDVGGYAWARMGFAPADEAAASGLRRAMRANLKAAKDIPADARAELTRILDASPNEHFAYEASSVRGAGKDEHWGQRVLLGTDWQGYVDLRSPAHRKRLQEALADA